MKRMIICIAALAVAAVACQEKEMPSPEAQDSPVFHAIIEEVSRAGFNYDALNKIYEHYWNNGDEVAIYQKGSKYDKYAITNAAAGTLEMVSAHAGDHTYTYEHNYAVYPYSYVSAEGGSDYITATLPADSPVFNASSPIYGYENILLGEGDDYDLTFKSQVGWLKLSLKGDFKVKNIRITGNGGEHLAASGIGYRWGFWYTPEVSSYTYCFADMGIMGSFYDYRNLRFEAPYPQLSGTATDFYIAIRDLILSTGYTLVITKEDDSTVTLVNRSPITISPNRVTPTAPLSVSDYAAVSTATSLGNETANCYVVSAAGTYRFRTVQGNSNTSVGAVASAEVLWETDNTYNTTIQSGAIIESVSYSPMGYILFSTPAVFKEGNALIAAKDEGGNILWSWHIWCTDEPSYTTLTYEGSTTTFMDRNLGALSATKGDGLATFGLYYNWGRKDPFYLERSYSSANDFARVKGTLTLPTASYRGDASKATISYVTAHPTEWVASGDGSQWVEPWFAENPAEPLWSNTKTIYDPCPPGYVTYNDNTTDSNILYKLKTDNQYSYGGSGSFPYMTVTDGTNEIWFPFAGRANSAESPVIFSGTGSPIKYRGVYWLGAYNTSPYNGQNWFFETGSASDLSGSWFTIMLGTTKASYLQSVRCQKK